MIVESPPPLGGCLYVIATPIGNLGDITIRAKEILATCDLIACEDTRTTRKLLDSCAISKPCVAYHDHNEQFLAEKLAQEIAAGKRIALVSDAGTPTISDPGFRVVRACRRLGLNVVAVPGPCAITAALSISGLPTHRFFFTGFLPPKSSQRLKFFNEQLEAEYTVVCYESCHRITSFLEDALQVFGPERVVCVCRELTKRFETVLSGPLAALLPQITGKQTKGEFVVLIAPKDYAL